MTLKSITKRFRIDNPSKFRLSDFDPDDREGLTKDKSEAKSMLDEGIARLAGLQERLYADDRWSVLIILQAMDAAGKDSVIEHVMSGLNPQGVEVQSVQATECGRARPRFPVAGGMPVAGARAHRDIQSLLLRRSPGRARPSRIAGKAATPRGIERQGFLATVALTTSAHSSVISPVTGRGC